MSAEILQALHVVDSDLPFASAESDGDRFRLQFPDSTIAKGYKQGKSKITYVVQHGIVPYIADLLQQNIATKPFSFKLDETTTSQIKKQYDAYLIYYTKEKKHTTTAYCGSVFVGHCTADDLLDHFHHFFQKLQLDAEFFLSFGRDGPNVNEKFETNARKDLEKKVSNYCPSVPATCIPATMLLLQV